MSHAKDTLYTEVYSIQHQATGTAGGPGFMSVMAAMTGFVGSGIVGTFSFSIYIFINLSIRERGGGGGREKEGERELSLIHI